MKSFAISMIVARVAAQTPTGSIGSTCVTDGAAGTWTPSDLMGASVTDADSCKAACETAIADGVMDYCCNSVVDDTPAVTACNLYANDASTDEDIRADYGTQSDTDYSVAWAWFAGVEQADLAEYPAPAPADDDTPADADADADDDADDEDMSVRMTASALAVASIAMLAM